MEETQFWNMALKYIFYFKNMNYFISLFHLKGEIQKLMCFLCTTNMFLLIFD